MTLEEAIIKVENLRKEINYHNDRYYNQDAPVISDFEYDKLIKDLEKLELDFPNLKTEDSPTQKVGGDVSSSFEKVEHKVKMESLHDVFSEGELFDFDKRVKETISDVQYVVEPKIDGLSVSVEYKKGVFVRGSTRGNGIIGEDITENLKTIKSLPKKIENAPEFLEIRGEVYMSNESFMSLLKQQELLGEKTFKNPRNAAAGSLRQKNAKITQKRNLDIFVFNIQKIDGEKLYTHEESLKYLENLGFKIPPKYRLCDSIEDCIKAIENIGNTRGDFSFQIDGAVVKVNSFAEREELGSTSKFPKWAEAFKYPPEEKESTLLDIKVNVGRTGVLTPIAILDPILLAGTTVSKATLHNQDLILEKDIRIGDTVIVRKAGDIIPEVVKVKFHNKNSKVFIIPDVCPSCGSKIIREKGESAFRCENTRCPAQLLRHMIHFVSRDAMNIDGLGPSVLEHLVNEKFVSSPADLYKLRPIDLITMDRMGKKSVDNLIKSLEKSKNNDLSQLIFGLGIRHIGKNAANLLTNEFKSIENIFKATTEEISNIDGYGSIMAESVVAYFSLKETKSLINELRSNGINMKTNDSKVSDVLKNKIFVITGTLPNYSRNEASKLIEKFGGKVSSSVSKKTSYVLAGENGGSKFTKAKELDIDIISEEDLIFMIK